MTKAILFDLDDTLLGNHMDTFLPSYFALLGDYVAQYMPRDDFLKELMICTEAMVQNVDPTVSNRDVFWQLFERRTGLDGEELVAFFDQFYRDQFYQLEETTEKRPFAAKLIQYCQKAGLTVVIATNPLFPRVAIEARLAWAGLPVDEYNFALVTTYENMHATKPQPAYYAEILQKIDCAPENALMVGDDWQNDIEPASSLGIHTYWLAPANEPQPSGLATYRGTSLQDLYVLLAAGWSN
jgi:HAD superfamily hydrolase (TIGR01549 family)